MLFFFFVVVVVVVFRLIYQAEILSSCLPLGKK